MLNFLEKITKRLNFYTHKVVAKKLSKNSDEFANKECWTIDIFTNILIFAKRQL